MIFLTRENDQKFKFQGPQIKPYLCVYILSMSELTSDDRDCVVLKTKNMCCLFKVC